ncbi:MAG TPA: hypothetical protein VK617_13825 [Gemmatimonadaceae bacterium]|nr:hypothetical protein [Gemmatimonadaceae bacterium]
MSLLLTLAAAACSRSAEKSATVAAGDSAPQIVSKSAAAPAPDSTTGNDTSDDSDTPTLDTSSVQHIDAAPSINAHAPSIAKVAKLSPLADSIAATLVFELKTQRQFLAASRAKKVFADIGRVDAPLKTPSRIHAYAEAVKVLSPVHIGDRFRLHGAWGQDDATVQSFDQWNGRIVAVLAVPPHVDSLARAKAPLVALAVRADSALPAVADSCVRDSVSTLLGARLTVLRDSILTVLQNDTVKMAPRLMKTLRAQKTQAIGCFGKSRVMIFVAQYAGDFEYYHQVAALVDTAGKVTPLRVNDLRFKVHEALGALDADGDGVDDIAVRGRAPRIGGTVILRLDPVKKRLDYVDGGFAWETF